jgi:hypothetical protein
MEKLTAKDLALYLGCKAYGSQKYDHPVLSESRTGELVDVDIKENSIWLYSNGVQQRFLPHNVKPILRPFSSLTEAEVKGISSIVHLVTFDEYLPTPDNKEMLYEATVLYRKYGLKFIEGTSEEIALICKYFISLGIDVFGWIEKGIAIDGTKKEVAP